MTTTEDVVGYPASEYFSYASRDGSLPVNDLAGELHLAERDGGVVANSTGGFRPQVPGNRMDLQAGLQRGAASAFRGLSRAYEARYGTQD